MRLVTQAAYARAYREATVETGADKRTRTPMRSRPDMRCGHGGVAVREGVIRRRYGREDLGAMDGPGADGITRAHRLRDLFDLTDPDYAFDLADLRPGHATINIRPKNPGSAGRPFGGSISFVVGKGSPEEAAIDDFMRYGRPVTIPSEFVAGVALDLPGNLGQLIPRMPARKSR